MQSYLSFILLIGAVAAKVATDVATTRTDLQREKRQLVAMRDQDICI